MQETSGYLHINEASKVYNKTRQTFYNYISRNLIRTKKVHNKVFLHRGDIEQLLSNYIDDAGEPMVQPSSPMQESVVHPQPTVVVQQETVHPSSHSIGTDWLYWLNDLKQELFMDNRNQLFTLQQSIQKATQETVNELSHELKQHKKNTLYHFIALKKGAFVLGYLGFIIVNILIFSHLP